MVEFSGSDGFGMDGDLSDLVVNTPRHFPRGFSIYQAGEKGGAWRVVAGTVRLDRGLDGDGHDALASLAVVGDIIGAETLLLERYTFTARALSDCTLIPWNEYGERPGHEGLLKALARAEQRFADILALRTGRATERVARLFSIMSSGVVGRRARAGQVLPRLRDIAEITGLTIETVSRTIKQLRGEGLPGLSGGLSAMEKEDDASGR
ncbi:Crp/Fnr family transcriptional regulator [Thauera sp. 63]|uniref:Crp/Fnr family transcriptional regulator n=1 Tax=Thauera sp. 63 TaxID=497321 RepID=UPI0018DEE54B|nr:Crp/Fnr family transcriptional regulator [Thauera sp. 63]